MSRASQLAGFDKVLFVFYNSVITYILMSLKHLWVWRHVRQRDEIQHGVSIYVTTPDASQSKTTGLRYGTKQSRRPGVNKATHR